MCLLKAKDDFHVPGSIPLVYQYARYIKVPNMVVISQYLCYVTMRWSIVVSRHFNTTQRCFKSSGMSQSGLPTIVTGIEFIFLKLCQPHSEVKPKREPIEIHPRKPT